MKIYLTALALFFHINSFAAEVKMKYTSSSAGPISRIWLPCSLGSCMIDLGGQGSLLALTNETKNLVSTKKVKITTLRGEEICDMVQSKDLSLAGMSFPENKLLRCPSFNPNISPMLGLNFFTDKKFGFYFSKQTFSWITDRLTNPQIKLTKIEGWFDFTANLGTVQINASLDTGTPTTLVDVTFFEAHKELFQVLDAEYQLFKLLVPLKIDKYEFSQTEVRVMNLKASFGPGAPDVFFGVNHLLEADWELDYQNLEMKLSKF